MYGKCARGVKGVGWKCEWRRLNFGARERRGLYLLSKQQRGGMGSSNRTRTTNGLTDRVSGIGVDGETLGRRKSDRSRIGNAGADLECMGAGKWPADG